MLIDTRTNTTALSEMLAAIRNEDMLGFAGVGVSRSLGYPDWRGLIGILANEARTHCGTAVAVDGQTLSVDDVEAFGDPLLSAKIFKASLGSRYFETMRSLFGPRGPRPTSISDLLTLPFRHIITSNYDPALDPVTSPRQPGNPASVFAWNNADALKDLLLHLGDRTYGKRVVHAHGRYDNPSSLILTEDDYMSLYSRSNVASLFWKIISIRERCVFFGFSFSDLDMLHGFREARDFLGTGRHFALMPLTLSNMDTEVQRRAEVRLKYGVTPVFFDPVDDTFSGYATSISRIAQELVPGLPLVSTGPGVTPPPAAPPPTAVTTGIQRDVTALDALTNANLRRHRTGALP